jgi:exoribonuclease R
MPARRVTLRVPASQLAPRFAAVRLELDVPDRFPDEVEEQARAAAARPVARDGRRDATAVPFVTVDPPGSKDLDQAFHAERCGAGFRVRYAIADVAAFVEPGGQLDLESRARGQTLYSPDLRTPLYPAVLSEGAASLLEGAERPALLWTIDLDASGQPRAVQLERALVRSRHQLDYAGVQAALDAGGAGEPLQLLREVGQLRLERERERDGLTVAVPEQQVMQRDGGYTLEYRADLPVEAWNAQISLLTGMCAAGLMLRAQVGLLRTLPPPDARAVDELRNGARKLGEGWPDGESFAAFVRTLDPARPHDAALLALAARGLRGAGYLAFDGRAPDAAHRLHSAIAAPYAHVTAPLRRLGDRFAGEIALAAASGQPPPAWARSALPELPRLLGRAEQRESALEHAVLGVAEASVLAGRTGERFLAVVLSVREREGRIQLVEPAVRAQCSGELIPGEETLVELVEADPERRIVRFVTASS